MKIKTADLCGRQLDCAVQMLEIELAADLDGEVLQNWLLSTDTSDIHRFQDDWLRAGEIIDREKISVVCAGGYWFARIVGAETWIDTDCNDEDCAPSAIIAALRCHVNNWFGDEVEIPDPIAEKL